MNLPGRRGGGESQPWVACIPAERLAAAAFLRDDPSVQAAHEPGGGGAGGGLVWLRGRGFRPEVAALPSALLFHLRGATGERLVPWGRRLPVRTLPEGLDWRPLADLCRPAPPRRGAGPGTPARRLSGAKLTVRLGGGTSPPGRPNLMRLRLVDWVAFASGAPSFRLEGLRFAASGAGEVYAWGRPLPSCPGSYFVEAWRVACPAGFHWTPRLEVGLLRKRLGLAAGDLAVLHPDGTWDRVGEENFLRASRSAARATYAAAGAPPAGR